MTIEYPLGAADEVPVGEGRAFRAGGTPVAVFRLRDGSLHAVSAVCPHAGGPIADGLVDAEVVICPLHQHVYELATGRSRTGQPPLVVYPVRVDDGQLILTVSHGTNGTPGETSGPADVEDRPELESTPGTKRIRPAPPTT